MVCLFQNLSCQKIFQNLPQYLCKYHVFTWAMKLPVSIKQGFAFLPYFRFTQSYQNSYINILCKHTGLFISICALFVSITNNFSVKSFVVWKFGSLIYLCFLTFFLVFPKTVLFIKLKKKFQNHFLPFF